MPRLPSCGASVACRTGPAALSPPDDSDARADPAIGTDTPAGVTIRRRTVPDTPVPLDRDSVVQRVLAARGIRSAEERDTSLATLPPPDALPDIEAAVTRLLLARDERQRILIVGDYDCDGATSTAVAVLGLTMLGFERPEVLVPNRFADGYGLSPAIVRQALAGATAAGVAAVGGGAAGGSGSVDDGSVDQGNKGNKGNKRGEPVPAPPPQLILTVDNGVASVDGVAHAREAGVDVVVTDHHLPPETLPEAVAIVNPNLRGATFGSTALAGVGVMFYVLLAIRQRLRARAGAGTAAAGSDAATPGGTAADATAARAPLADLLDLVAVGTVADVVPLDRLNRTLVAQGIRRIRAGRCRPGVSALLKTAAREPQRLQADDIGFAIGPRLNAAGRLADMSIGVACLLTESPEEAQRLADELDTLNRERRRIEQGMREEAELRLATSEIVSGAGQGVQQRFGVVLADPGWHEGVIGILAGRLKERLHRPVVALTHADAHRLKGSARSIPGVHVRDVLQAIAARHPDLFIAYGGHAMAAGMTLPSDKLPILVEAFDEEVSRVLQGRLPDREWLTDGELPRGMMTIAQARRLADCGPWGQGFEAPSFDGLFRVVERRIVGTGHLKLVVTPHDGGAGADLDAIAFNREDELEPGDEVRLVYRLDINVYRNAERLQLMVLHLERADR